MSKVQFITLIITLVGVQVAAQYFLPHGHDFPRDEVSLSRDMHSDKKDEREIISVSIANKVQADSGRSDQCEGGGVDYLADKINEIAYQLESFSDRIDDLSESNDGTNINSNGALKKSELGEAEIDSVYQEALSIMEGISSDSNSKDRFDKEGEVMDLLSTIPVSRRSEFHKKLF